jgi:endonuclease/exonuclease/phosphatase family metal-dependent hydrolase
MKGHRPTVLTGISLLLLLLLLLGACHARNPNPIVIDGQLGDWSGIPAIVTDQPQQAPGFQAIYMSHDADSIFIRLDLNAAINYQSLLESTLTFYFDADGNRDTGSSGGPLPGAEIAIELSPLSTQSPGRPRQGARVLVFPDQSDSPEIESGYYVGLMGAPAYSAREFEFRIARGTHSGSGSALFTGDHLRGKLVHAVSAEQVLQQSPEFVYQLSASSPPATLTAQQIETLLSANEAETIRVLSWNIADHNFQRSFDAYGRILATVKPDVLLLDEAPQDITEENVRKLLVAMDPATKASSWQIHIGVGGGRQRGVIASHLPVEVLPEYDPLHYPQEVVEYVRNNGTTSMLRDLADMHQEAMPVLGARLDWAGREILLVTMDFQCCGYDGSPEDGFRSRQAKLVRQALGNAINRSGIPDAVILAGDLNLVGSNRPLDTLLDKGDLDGRDLLSVDPLQLNQATTATYGFKGLFSPGQLDFMIFSNSSLELVRSFVLDSRELPESLATRLGVNPNDSAQSSDHMPIVADFRIR